MIYKSLSILSLAALLLFSNSALAVGGGSGGPSPKPPCSAKGALGVTTVTPSATYSYVNTVLGFTTGQFAVSNPSVSINPSCDNLLPYVYGNGTTGSDLNVGILIADIIPDSVCGITLTPAQETQIKNAFLFTPDFFTLLLNSLGNDTKTVGFQFANVNIPACTYDISISAKPETGAGVGEAFTSFTLNVTDPVVLDTLAPVVTINSPQGDKVCLNYDIPVEFTAYDPLESGAGTGINAMRASYKSNGGAVTGAVSPLSLSSPLPVVAGVTVTAAGSITANGVGEFELHAEADDLASPTVHTGYQTSTYTVSLNVNALPPMSVVGRQFKVGSTLPIKWTFTDCNGNLLPPFSSVSVKIKAIGVATQTRIAGSGASDIRWELDEYGNALHYITNYPIPAIGNYEVEVYVNDVDNKPALQSTLTFVAGSKGGKI